MNSIQWMRKITNGDDVSTIARKTGTPRRTLYRQVERGELSVDNVLLIAKSYKANPIHALVELGFIEAHWTSTPSTKTVLKTASEDELCAEILRRLKLGSKAFDEPIDKAEQRLQGNRHQVTLSDPSRNNGVNELKPEPKPDDPWATAATVSGKDSWRGDEMVADDSEEEGFLGDDNYSDGP